MFPAPTPIENYECPSKHDFGNLDDLSNESLQFNDEPTIERTPTPSSQAASHETKGCDDREQHSSTNARTSHIPVDRPAEVLTARGVILDVLCVLHFLLALGQKIAFCGIQIGIRATHATAEDLRRFLNSLRRFKEEPGSESIMKYRFGIPFVTFFGISVIFTALLTMRTLLVLTCSCLSDVKTSISATDPNGDSPFTPADHKTNPTGQSQGPNPLQPDMDSEKSSSPLLISGHTKYSVYCPGQPFHDSCNRCTTRKCSSPA
ncbi:hypothetical protein HYDPIDRAFT_110065 [Hydnomerulius pinastri MD-312]|nr:hypothetical protein HYDPIDRAFT_110065 [Hydnomerulius pinastri MD-312]